MKELKLRLAIDFSGFEELSVGAGQFRYLVSLVRGLAPRLSSGEGWLLSPASNLPDELQPYCAPKGPFRYRKVARPLEWEPLSLTHISRYAIAQELRLDVLHAVHVFLPIIAPCAMVLTILDLMPEMFPEYDSWARSRRYRYYRYLARERADAVVCASETTAEDVRSRWRVAEERIFTTPLAVAAFPRENIVLPTSVPTSGRWILSPYNLEPRKNLRRLLEAFAQVPDPGDEMRLVLFGRAANNPDREREFDELLARLSIERKVLRTGFVSDAALATMYRRCTAFVYPSLYEGFGLPVLEAMANGACVLVGDRSAMKEVVDQAGVLMDVDSPSAMARAITETLADERERQRLSEKARARSTAFTVERLADQTIAAYRFAARQFASRLVRTNARYEESRVQARSPPLDDQDG